MIPLGYELGSGARVKIPVNHTVVLGQTQLSGKTTTLEAMVTRSDLRAVGFITKPGESSFRLQTQIPAFFSESGAEEYWKHVVAMLEYRSEVKLGWRERGVVIKLCQDYKKEGSRIGFDVKSGKSKRERISYKWKVPKSLHDVLGNLELYLPYARSSEEMICIQLREFLRPVLSEIEKTSFSDKLQLARGINVMDITELSDGLKALVIRSVIEWVHKHGRKIVVIIPEAWKFIPEGRSTPVKLALEGLIREGAGVGNFVWMDSQDLRGVDKLLLRSVIVWLFGVQRQKNEVASTLASIPDHPKPSATEIMQLGKGEFYVCYGTTLLRTYVQPAGMEDAHAQAIARGEERPESWTQIVRSLDAESGESRPVDGDMAGRSASDLDGDRQDHGPPGHPDLQEEARPISAAEEETMWKEKHEQFLREVHQPLVEAHDALAKRVRDLEKERTPAALAATTNGETVTGEMAKWFEKFPKESLEATYRYIRKRLRDDPQVALALTTPDISVKVERPVITVEANGSLFGRICQLTSEGFFKLPQGAKAATAEAVRRGWCHPKTPFMRVQDPLEKLAGMGFLTREIDGYQMVPGMKVNIVEARA
jgi:hypothetical protein